ncbi:MAG: undecaprenyldiphospho-muramoylpentapeptide beta-N-acetylglucosaminyltransferase [Sandaracinaceae bacterium]
MIRRVIMAGGGTGGHLFPAIAVVEELRRRQPGVEVTFVGTARGIEARVLPERGERLELLEVEPLKGRTTKALLRSLRMLPSACLRASKLVTELRPDVVIGVGGYAAGPMLAAAAARGVPTAILEQNAHVGLTNRMLAPLAGRAYVAFEDAAKQLGEGKARLVGNPVRRAFVDAARAALIDPDGFEARASTVLVLGGSQGAKALNEAVPAALARLDLSARGIHVIHQTGAAMRDEVQARYAALGVEAEVVSFLDDMARAYSNAALVIARAGATTLAEVCAVGRAAILVPYPYAADDHQAVNAAALERDGAAIRILERDLSEALLAGEARRLLEDRGARARMAEAARKHGRPDAAAAIVDDLVGWLGGPPRPEELARDLASDPDEGGGMRFASIDFRARRGLALQRMRSSAPPPPAYLELRGPTRTVDPLV